MLLLPSRKSALKDHDMVLSQMRSFIARSNPEQEREDNNNVIAEKEVLRSPTAKCRFHDKQSLSDSFVFKQIGRIIYEESFV